VHNNPASIIIEVLADLDGDGVLDLSDCAPEDSMLTQKILLACTVAESTTPAP